MLEELKPFKVGDKSFYLDRLDWPYIWKEYSQKDYITGYSEDMWYSTFEYMKKGFYGNVSTPC